MAVGRHRHVVVTASSLRRRVARDDHQRSRAAVAVARPVAAAREVKEGIPPAAGSDGGTGAMGPYPDEGVACGSGICRVGPGGRASTPHAGP